MTFASGSTADAHANGDCWPSQCPACLLEDAYDTKEED